MQALAQAYEAIAHLAGHVLAVPLSIAVLALLWALAGLDITNFAISIVSLLLLFILQSSSNRDGLAIQTKLDLLIKAVEAADNSFMGIDTEPEDTIKAKREAL
jgi:low affinity Fe/Cu permease